MYSRFQIARKYLTYYLRASSRRGFGIHSPFVFDFVTKVLNDRRDFREYQQVEQLRSKLLKSNTTIEFQDLGAGKGSGTKSIRTIADISVRSAKNRKLGQLLFRMARHYQPATILEMGTSLGLSTAYLATACPLSRLVTLEGEGRVAEHAKKNFESLGLTHIEMINGNFEESLPMAVSKISDLGLVFMDGNHSKEPTLNYFNLLLKKTATSSLIIVDDIHWSREMEDAWKQIREDPQVMMTIDLFFMGLVFFRESFKVKQHFTIRF